tara:strand:- start:576 stop:746 length:171 start_codon:yes stop_codon:yes gene_type:complete
MREIDKRIDAIEKTLDKIQNNHLSHLIQDMAHVKKFVIVAALGVVINLGVVLTTIF